MCSSCKSQQDCTNVALKPGCMLTKWWFLYGGWAGLCRSCSSSCVWPKVQMGFPAPKLRRSSFGSSGPGHELLQLTCSHVTVFMQCFYLQADTIWRGFCFVFVFVFLAFAKAGFWILLLLGVSLQSHVSTTPELPWAQQQEQAAWVKGWESEGSGSGCTSTVWIYTAVQELLIHSLGLHSEPVPTWKCMLVSGASSTLQPRAGWVAGCSSAAVLASLIWGAFCFFFLPPKLSLFCLAFKVCSLSTWLKSWAESWPWSVTTREKLPAQRNSSTFTSVPPTFLCVCMWNAERRLNFRDGWEVNCMPRGHKGIVCARDP